MKTTLGGDRLGSGNKQELSFRNYERSSHDLSYLWRSSMSSGTLVPFMNLLALPGDNFKIELNTDVLTLPTIGPLFGSYKVQLDVFETPLRLYNAKLHMNKLGIGMDMSEIYLPMLRLLTNNHTDYDQTFQDNEQVNPSSLAKYLGISGLGTITGTTNPAKRDFNACPFLAYWDIYKNYYSNKQEEYGYFIHTDANTPSEARTPIYANANTIFGQNLNILGASNAQTLLLNDQCYIQYPPNCPDLDSGYLSYIPCHANGSASTLGAIATDICWVPSLKQIQFNISSGGNNKLIYIDETPASWYINLKTVFGINSFPLTNIDDMREAILQWSNAGPFVIDYNSTLPYSCFMKESAGSAATLTYSIQYSQEGLGLKTYQSDLFNNWINTEWIDGEGGISELTAIDTSADSFTIDALNIATKVYMMLNRIAVSGGTYDDWLEAVYTHERVKGVESPVYHGSLIKELAFQEVISNAATETEPLGTLAGRGRLTSKHKGGLISITVNEPSIIMGIVSITPRIEYSQGNDWTVNLKTFNDFHKPALDGIGFQDLITDQLLWTDTECASLNGALTLNSLGKQPAWINYMTSVNKVYGSFADENDSMFMVLNRRFDRETDGVLLDGTTYIDPSKFNHIFANTSLDSQNFWVQISCDILARRKMSAKIIPNL